LFAIDFLSLMTFNIPLSFPDFWYFVLLVKRSREAAKGVIEEGALLEDVAGGSGKDSFEEAQEVNPEV